jgi:hypothetical protein
MLQHSRTWKVGSLKQTSIPTLLKSVVSAVFTIASF